MVWNSLSPDGTKSVRQNTVPMAQNTTYVETTQNNDHFWNIGTDEDGYHRKVSMESYADTAIGAPVDAPIPSGMDAVYYLKSANGRIQGHYRNANGIYQCVPSFISGTVNINGGSSYTNIVAVPNECYGQIFLWGSGAGPSMTMGYFRATNGTVDTYSCLSYLNNNTSTENSVFVFGNGSAASGLNIRVRTKTIADGFFDYRIIYWAI